jgi:hypothetical protein
MHKTLPVADIHIDDIGFVVNRIDSIYEPLHFPPGVLPATTSAGAQRLNEWWKGRAIPASRSGLRDALERLHISSPQDLLIKCFGLSLSDQYWVKPANKDLKWEEVNFFQNDFSEDIGKILFGEPVGHKSINLSSPDNTSDGWLKKKWVISEGKRVLLKGGSNPYQQEPFNEVLATAIMRRLGINHVPYRLVWEHNKPLSACEDFVTPDTELVSAWHLLEDFRNNRKGKQKNSENDYMFFIRCCKEMGIPDARNSMDKMLSLDYLIANTDRHYNNFGALRNAQTLEWLGIAPVYDSGTSMWHDVDTENIARYYNPDSKPFRTSHKEQIKLVQSLDWLDISALEGIEDEWAEVLRPNENISPTRIGKLCKALGERITSISTAGQLT